MYGGSKGLVVRYYHLVHVEAHGAGLLVRVRDLVPLLDDPLEAARVGQRRGDVVADERRRVGDDLLDELGLLVVADEQVQALLALDHEAVGQAVVLHDLSRS
jgi:hypothetical protein